MNHLSSKQIELNTQNSCYTQVSGTVFSNRANINRLEWDTFLSLYLRSLIASPSLWIRSIPFTPLTLSAFHLIRTRIIANCVPRLIDWSIKRENSNGAHSTHASISVFGIFIVFFASFFFLPSPFLFELISVLRSIAWKTSFLSVKLFTSFGAGNKGEIHVRLYDVIWETVSIVSGNMVTKPPWSSRSKWQRGMHACHLYVVFSSFLSLFNQIEWNDYVNGVRETEGNKKTNWWFAQHNFSCNA